MVHKDLCTILRSRTFEKAEPINVNKSDIIFANVTISEKQIALDALDEERRIYLEDIHALDVRRIYETRAIAQNFYKKTPTRSFKRARAFMCEGSP